MRKVGGRSLCPNRIAERALAAVVYIGDGKGRRQRAIGQAEKTDYGQGTEESAGRFITQILNRQCRRAWS